MTNETETVNSQNHNTLHIPSREEFHKRYGGEIRGYDFCTDYYPISIGQDKGSRIAEQIEGIESVKRNYIWKKLLIKKDIRNMRRSKNCIVF